MTRKSVITPEEIKITYSRSPNLKDKLVKSKHRFPTQTQSVSTMLATKMPKLQSHEHLPSYL